MRVIVADTLFDGSVLKAHLTALLYFAFQGRHRVIVEPGPRPHLRGWMGALGEDEREAYERALAWSDEVESRENAEHEIRVGGDGVAIEEAIERLGRPFLLLLENDVSDRAFVEAIASEEQYRRLSSMEKKGWMEARCRGGVTGITPMIEAELRRFPEDAKRMFAIFDGDAPERGSPSKDARDAKGGCERRGVAYTMLERRSIENYLTRAALEAWAEDQDKDTGKRLQQIEQLYDQWFDERPERRHHYPMKKGFGALSPKPSLYKEIPLMIEGKLKEGFGPDVYRAFVPGQIRETDLRNEGAWEEISGMMEALMKRMR